jgi:hypothetical protein
MANRNAPFGLQPHRHLTGGIIRASDRYRIASALASDIGVGSRVVETGTSDAFGNPRIDLSAVDGPCTGVFMGCSYRDSAGNVVYSKEWVSGTVTYNSEPAVALVIDDPNVTYRAQMSLALVAANIGLRADMTAEAVNALGMSTQAVDSSDLAGDAVKILGVVNRPGNEIGNYAIVEVVLVDGITRAAI